ncbi:MAG: DUF1080 domain-containing protein [Kiritimatiellae bacterium]|nr:DUF1080 domain-containing protein [Kiritimatiellia bacterium]MDD5519714.1 DUF1080 domain-containing protein [Kiritimatiellia bacterium]
MKNILSRFAWSGIMVIGLVLLQSTVYGADMPGAGSCALKPEEAGKLIAVLQSSDASQFDKARACQQLEIIGAKDAVPAFAALLTDEKLSNYARSGLEAITDPSADNALRKALGKFQGKLLIGVVNSIGMRRDAKAVKNLIELVRDPSKGAANEALLALGRIGTAKTIETLQKALTSGPAEFRAAAAEGCLLCAERQLAQGKRDVAVKLYDAVNRAEVPKQLQVAAMHGAVLARQTAGLPLLIEQLKSSDMAMVGIALRLIRELSGTEVTQALVAELGKVRPEIQVLLIKALVDRNDPTVRGAIEALAVVDSPEVRTATAEALGKIGGFSSIPVLLKLIEAGKTEAESTAAAASLTLLASDDTDNMILKAVPSAQPVTRAKLIAILGNRNAEIAVTEVLKQAGDPDAAVSKAAFIALASISRPGDLPEIIKLTLACKDDSVHEKAERAVFETCMKIPSVSNRSNTIMTIFKESKDTVTKCALMKMLGMIGDFKSCNVIISALNDPDVQIQDTALRVLVDWPDATPTAVLLDTVKKTTNPVHRTLALRGAVRMAGKLATDCVCPSRQVIGWLTQANQMVRKDVVDEKRLILSGLANLKCLEGLQLVQTYLEDAGVQSEAELAVINIAKLMTQPNQQLMAKSLVEKIIKTTKNGAVRHQAGEVIKQIPGKSIEFKAPAQTDDKIDVAKLTFIPLFDGQTYTGWEGETYKSFRIENGAIVGGSLKNRIPQNEFLCTTRSYGDFILRLECKLAGHCNAGIQIRSQRVPSSSELCGYQADMDSGGKYWGCLYDESRRGWLVKSDPTEIMKIVKRDDWNLYEIRCEGPRIQLFVNGIQTVDYTEKDETVMQSGIIGLQIHGGDPSESRYRNITIAELP